MRLIKFSVLLLIITSCSSEDDSYTPVDSSDTLSAAVTATFGSQVDFDNLHNYAAQPIPAYITKDNTSTNTITDEKATLGRILFYDKNLSTDNSIACASCHKQQFAFGDENDVSPGVNGNTARHSMRLINSRFADEVRFFWDERAPTLEQQVTQPIQDHAEMGFSGTNGSPGLGDLLDKLAQTTYYPQIFDHIYGDDAITEARLKEALAQFVRSIQSFDAPFDIGIAQVGAINQNFPNYTAQENQGKQLFLNPPDRGGAGCAGCHRGPEFDIDPNSRNNGVFGIFDALGTDEIVTRAPSLRDVVNGSALPNGNLMHDASMSSLREVILHYNSITPGNNGNLDIRLRGGPGQNGQQLNLTDNEMAALEAFLETLTGSAVYTDSKWSDPFR